MASTEVFTRIAEKMDLTFVLKMVHGLADHHVDDSTLIFEQLEVEAHDWHHLLVAILDEKVTAYASLMPIGQLQFGVRGMDMHRLSCPKQLSCKCKTVGTHPDNTAAAEVYLAAGFERLPNAPRFRIGIDG